MTSDTGASPTIERPVVVAAPRQRLDHRVRIDGKQFAAGPDRFTLRGVTYGTFRRRTDGAAFPDRERLAADLDDIADAGFTVVRTYTAPPDDLVELAAARGLRLFPEAFSPDWRYLIGSSRRQRHQAAREMRSQVRNLADRLGGRPELFALSLGNELPADVIRWYGTRAVTDLLDSLAEVAHEADPDLLVTYANYPTAEYLDPGGVDFVTFNVYLEDRSQYRRYLTRLQNLAGDRPLVLGEVGISSGPDPADEASQADALDWQLEVAIERGVAGTCVFSWTDDWWIGDEPVEGWRFGLTDGRRRHRPALDVARRWNGRTVRDLDHDWPTASVVICAYNAEATLDECLRHTCELDYPGLEIIVVDDGSEDATADIARRHPRARLLELPHGGLSVARNEGALAASGDLVVYLDSDAFPTPEWLYYLALGLDGPTVGGVGGPNVAPVTDGVAALQVAQAPGGPAHVLVADDRAEHVPGCNMAFWRSTLFEVGGFDPIYTAAGDDVDICWKVLDRGWDIGFHPAALVWHHRRTGLRPYLRQQRGYGRAEALVEARHPDRFSTIGGARWRGHIYTQRHRRAAGDRIYRGTYGTAPFQSIYRGGGHASDVAHQIGVPLAVATALTAPAAAFEAAWAFPATVAFVALVVLGLADAARARVPHGVNATLRFRLGVGSMHLCQPIARAYGRLRHRHAARRDVPIRVTLPMRLDRPRRRVLVYPATRQRHDMTSAIIDAARADGLTVLPATGWEDHDARLRPSWTLEGRLVTSSHPPGWIQVRVRRRPRPVALVVFMATALVAAVSAPPIGAAVAVVAFADLGRGWWRSGPGFRRSLAAVER